MSGSLAEPEMLNDLRGLLRELQYDLMEVRDGGGYAEPDTLERMVLLTERAQEILAFDSPPTQSACPLHNASCPYFSN